MANQALQIRDKTIFDGIIGKYLFKYFFKAAFKITGWKTTNTVSKGAGITIAAPHTSNWDFFYALGAAIILDKKIYFSIKDNWCKVPVVGSFIMWLGAIPINRSSGGKGQVELIKNFVERHRDRDIFFLFTPEGTRGKTDKWKTGFYHVAEDTGLPIFLAKVDYQLKESGVFHSYQITGDKEDDIRAIQESYKSIYGKHIKDQFPEYAGPMPEISAEDAAIMKAVYSFKGLATQMDIASKLKLSKLSTGMLDFLTEKGILERSDNGSDEPTYRLTFVGKGYLLHLVPVLEAV
ncbi:1-acyl-sn-glycerol-3-phosphate acyltransferase [Leucothrix pacifica]|uniref:Acyltransferase n=1 Tax=Leucothrix pacifica TaxID=1247513 RepID=A0A317C218_9GAMM|nr:1-acyl-sn-glycerol-3-phosphate acyltransferase [Leucothrix pacifica]PWQ92664.1 acyltransferase [Leucothrix pacifica]